MKLLMVCPQIPYPPYVGGNVRIFNQVKRLAKRMEVTLLCLSDRQQTGQADPLRQYCREIHVVPIHARRSRLEKLGVLFQWREWPRHWERIKQGVRGVPYTLWKCYHPALQKKLHALSGRENFDIIQFEFMEMGNYAGKLKQAWNHGAWRSKLVLTEHDITSVLLRRKSRYAPWWKKPFMKMETLLMEKYEKTTLPLFDHIIAVSRHDGKKLAACTGKGEKISVSRNGVDIVVHGKPAMLPTEARLLFLGTMAFYPNYDGLTWFINEVYPLLRQKRPEVRIDVVGEKAANAPSGGPGHGVSYHGIVPRLEEVAGHAMMMICPIRIGAGSKLKVVTAMALGLPVVSTAVGLEGIEAGRQDGVCVANDAAGFAERILELAEDLEKRRQYGAAARRFVEKEYAWDDIVEGLVRTYGKLVSAKRD